MQHAAPPPLSLGQYGPLGTLRARGVGRGPSVGRRCARARARQHTLCPRRWARLAKTRPRCVSGVGHSRAGKVPQPGAHVLPRRGRGDRRVRYHTRGARRRPLAAAIAAAARATVVCSPICWPCGGPDAEWRCCSLADVIQDAAEMGRRAEIAGPSKYRAPLLREAASPARTAHPAACPPLTPPGRVTGHSTGWQQVRPGGQARGR